MKGKLLLAQAALCLGLATPAHAAPLILPDRDCYTPGEEMVIEGLGFTAGADIVFGISVLAPSGAVQNYVAGPITARDQGVFFAPVRSPDFARKGDRRELMIVSATEQQSPDTGPTSFSVPLSAVGVDVADWQAGRVKPGRLTRVRVYGIGPLIDSRGFLYEPGDPLYVHYLRGTRVVKTAKVGDLGTTCGDLDTRMRQFPFDVKPGTYTVVFDSASRYDRRAASVRYQVTVPRRGEKTTPSTGVVKGRAAT